MLEKVKHFFLPKRPTSVIHYRTKPLGIDGVIQKKNTTLLNKKEGSHPFGTCWNPFMQLS